MQTETKDFTQGRATISRAASCKPGLGAEFQGTCGWYLHGRAGTLKSGYPGPSWVLRCPTIEAGIHDTCW